jgi:hypothetical protein
VNYLLTSCITECSSSLAISVRIASLTDVRSCQPLGD